MFVRTLLAMSLSCIFASTAFAAATAEQPLNPQQVHVINKTLTTVQAPVVSDNSSVDVDTNITITQQEQLALTKATQTLESLQSTEDHSAAIGIAAASEAVSTANTAIAPTPVVTANVSPASTAAVSANATSASTAAASEAVPSTSATTSVPASWTLNGLNNASWYDNIGKGQFPVYARAHVMLNNAHASPGAIDGASGHNTLKAIAAFQQMNGLKSTGVLTKETWDKLVARQGSRPTFVEYTITAKDLAGPYAKSIPSDYALQAKMAGLYYTRSTEMLSEKFHMDEEFLKKINPGANFNKVGQKIIVSNVRNNLPEDIHLIVAIKAAKQLYLFNSKNQMIASFPASIGNTNTPSPTGTYKVTGVAPNPWYSYSPSNFVQGKNLKPLSLPPGPNGPVGNIWIGLSKRSFGIHGTPNPSMISKSYSHGCIRLTNWDANDLGKKVKAGVTVRFL